MKIKKKNFLIKKDELIICSKCGKIILKDTYQYSKHNDFCKANFENLYEPLKESDFYGYCFAEENEKLSFNVFKFEINKERNTYLPGKWKQVYKALFEHNNKIIKEKGLYNIDIWCKKIVNSEYMYYIGTEDANEVITNYFKSIPYVDSLGMFIDIYRQRGYRYNDIDISKLPKIENNININKKQSFVVDEIEIDDNIILTIDYIKQKQIKNRFYISNDFVYSINKDYEILKNKEIPWEIKSIEKFIKKYPQLNLDKYINNNGVNIFRAITSQSYNKLEEILCKGGLSFYADNCSSLLVNNVYGNNIKEIFGLNLKIIKCLNNAKFLLKNIDDYNAVQYLYNLQPALFDINYKEQSLFYLIKSFENSYLGIKNIKSLDKNEILKMANMLNDFSENITNCYVNYRDYMNTCDLLNCFPYGKVPKNPHEADLYVSEIYRLSKNKIVHKKFKEAVNKKIYKLLDSEIFLDENNELIKKENKKDKYRIILPSEEMDLNKESEQLHHCVRTYIEKVAEEETYILFVRDKKDIQKSLATIEIIKDRNNKLKLIQLKAYANNKAPSDVISFVQKYANKKGIIIDSYDI